MAQLTILIFLCFAGLSGCAPRGAKNWPFSIGPQTYAAALGDLDGDGDLDAFLANGENEVAFPNTVWLNDGSGGFTNSGQMVGERESHGVILADMDLDGDLDALVSNTGDISLYLNIGAGNFGESSQNLGSYDGGVYIFSPAVGDLDGDGDPDVLAGGCCGGAAFYDDGRTEVFLPYDKLWLNNGSGTFNVSPQSFDTYGTSQVALGDLDSDGDLDALFGNTGSTRLSDGELDRNEPDTIWFNNGGIQGGLLGTFSISSQMLSSAGSLSLELDDLDGDGDLDVLAGSRERIEIWINDGGAQNGEQGKFSPSATLPTGGKLRLLLYGDIDGDGLNDIIAVEQNSAQAWLREEGLNYRKGAVFRFNAQHGLALGDLDGDGDLDLFGGSVYHNIMVWLNDGEGGFKLSTFTTN